GRRSPSTWPCWPRPAWSPPSRGSGDGSGTGCARRRCRWRSSSWPRWPATGTARSARCKTTSTGLLRGPPPPQSSKPGDVMADHGFPSPRAAVGRAATAAVLAATLGLAAASWGVAVWQMHGMDMGVATRLGSFAFFTAVWVVMMAAMMLPGAAPAVLRRTRDTGGGRAGPLFVGAYLAVWALAGVAGYALYRAHGPVAAPVVGIAAGVYELTPLKGYFAGAAARVPDLASGSGCAAPGRASG